MCLGRTCHARPCVGEGATRSITRCHPTSHRNKADHPKGGEPHQRRNARSSKYRLRTKPRNRHTKNSFLTSGSSLCIFHRQTYVASGCLGLKQAVKFVQSGRAKASVALEVLSGRTVSPQTMLMRCIRSLRQPMTDQ